MSVVYKVTDTFDLKVDNVVVSLSPLSYEVKADMQAYVLAGKPMSAGVLALRHSVKNIKGLKLPDGSDYELEFENGVLTKSTISDLLNLPEGNKVNIIAISLINGMPKGEFLDPETGNPMEGVKFVTKKGASRKK